MSEFWAVFSLFWSSFLSATLLPGSSEVVLISLLSSHSASPLWLILIASIGNTLGGITNIVIGRLAPELKPQKRAGDGAPLAAALWHGSTII
ncbi:hypothetical protein OS12_43860 [Dickeya oryzae]